MIRNYLLILLFLYKGISSTCQQPGNELRGVWIATISNIDWPSASNLSSKQQKNEIISILDFYKKLNFNAVFVQIRPSADTFYPSEYEPWSKYLTGKQGQKPKPYYDPLDFWIKEAHKRNIEFHAWINPYRITTNEKEVLCSDHPAILHPDWVIKYGNKMYYNPGIPECKDHIKNVVEEIVSKYNVDAIHFDDYFYPYPVNGENFPDSLTYLKYGNEFSDINDWRRDNVDQTIKELSFLIKSINPHVKFGISPFGVWRNQADDSDGSVTSASVTNYDNLYADVIKWLKNEWIDYVTPQIYWSTDNKVVPFEHLTQWWANHSYGKDLYIGHAVYKIGKHDGAWNDPNQTITQINIARNTPNVNGSVFFSHRQININPLGIADSLKNNLFKYPGLIKEMPWISIEPPPAPCCIRYKNGKLKWKYDKNYIDAVKEFAIYSQTSDGKSQLIAVTKKEKYKTDSSFRKNNNITAYKIIAVNYTNNKSSYSIYGL